LKQMFRAALKCAGKRGAKDKGTRTAPHSHAEAVSA
jgi:hypothetical protein